MTQPKTTSRSAWHKTNGKWSCSLGGRGTRVRLFEMTKGGVFYRDIWHDGYKSRRSLGTTDKREAEKLGRQLLGELLSGRRIDASSTVELRTLWERYRRECAEWLDNHPRSRKGSERSAEVLLAFFGPTRDVTTLSRGDVLAFQAARLKGGIPIPGKDPTGPTRARSVQSDLKFLRAMLRWATTVQVGGRNRLLATNPLDGIQLVAERNERRPIASVERFAATRSALEQLVANAKSEPERTRWVKVDLALVLAEATGRRVNSIRALRWEDIDLSKETITWRADADKKGRESTVPIPKLLADELKSFRKKLGAIAGNVFPSKKDPGRPMSRHDLSWWLRKAEEAAGLLKLTGGLWHPYRRKWATERKEYPIKDLMAAGGWSDSATVLKCYQQADQRTLLRVMSEPRKLSESLVPDTPQALTNG